MWHIEINKNLSLGNKLLCLWVVVSFCKPALSPNVSLIIEVSVYEWANMSKIRLIRKKDFFLKVSTWQRQSKLKLEKITFKLKTFNWNDVNGKLKRNGIIYYCFVEVCVGKRWVSGDRGKRKQMKEVGENK